MTRNGGKWTQARFNSFIKSGLRAMSRRWPPKFECLADACVGTKTNKATGRMAKHYECVECHNQFPAKGVAVDHIDPVVPLTGFTTWDEVIERMFVEKDGLQVLCKTCHDAKSKQEKEQRIKKVNIRKEYPMEEASWRNMISRCTNPKATGYAHYGGRGISVVDEWFDFNNFYRDMGPRPDGTSLDRIDVDGNYCKENCRWANKYEQANNRLDNHYISYDNKVLTLSQWEDITGIQQNTILYRIRRGWPVGEALGLEERTKPHTSRLSKGEWLEIQALRDCGYSTVELGKMFNIDPSQISRKTTSQRAEE